MIEFMLAGAAMCECTFSETQIVQLQQIYQYVFTLKTLMAPALCLKLLAILIQLVQHAFVVPCNRQHEIILTSQFQYQTSDTHNLPALFPFTNPLNKRVIFTSPLITDASVVSGDGPVYNSPTACRDQSQQDYHFKFSFTNYPKPGKLTPTEPQPGLPNSWYPEPATSPEREACMVRVRVDVSIAVILKVSSLILKYFAD